MQKIELRVNEKIYDKFLWLLSKFSKEDIEIISKSEEYVSVQEYLQAELNEMNEGKAKYISQSELENRLDEII